MAGSTTNYGATKPAVGEAYDVNITNNNSDIFDTQIKNVDTLVKKIRHAEFTAVSTSNTAGAAWDVGTLVNSTPMVNNTFCVVGPSAGKLQFIEVGTYEVHLVVKPRTNPGANYVSIKDDADSYFFDLKKDDASIKWENSASAVVYAPTQPFNVFFRTQWATGATICDTVIRVNKIAGV